MPFITTCEGSGRVNWSDIIHNAIGSNHRTAFLYRLLTRRHTWIGGKIRVSVLRRAAALFLPGTSGLLLSVSAPNLRAIPKVAQKD
jgi:hypothetical protein